MPVGMGAVIDVLKMLLLRPFQIVGCRAEATQQREHGQRHDAQHGDFAQRVEAAEIHQDDVDDIGAAAFGIGVLQKISGDAAGRIRPCHHGIGEKCQPAAGSHRDHKIAHAPEPRRIGEIARYRFQPFGQPAQPQHDQNGGHRLHHQLGQGKVRRRQQNKSDAGGEPRATHQDKRGQPVIFRLIGRTDGADHTARPDQRKRRIDGGWPERSGPGALDIDRKKRGEKRGANQKPHLRLKPIGAEGLLQRFRPAPGQHDDGAFEYPLFGEQADHRRPVRRNGKTPAPEEIERNPARDGDGAHQQRQREAMPYPKAVTGCRFPKNRTCRRRQKRLDRHRRNHADHDADEDQRLDRETHPARRFMRRARQVARGRAEENTENETQRIDHAEYAGQRRDIGQCRIDERAVMGGDGLREEHLLRQEAIEQRHTGHGGGGHHGKRRGDRHEAVKPAQAAQITGAGFMVDDPGGHEQRRLEGGVIDDVKDRGQQGQRRIEPQQQRDQPEMADRRIGEKALQVLLEHGVIGAEHKRDQPRGADEPEPVIRARQHRPQTDQQENPGLHHGGGMQIGRYRRWCRHRPRQPEMKRKLGAFGQRTEQDKDQGREIERA